MVGCGRRGGGERISWARTDARAERERRWSPGVERENLGDLQYARGKLRIPPVTRLGLQQLFLHKPPAQRTPARLPRAKCPQIRDSQFRHSHTAPIRAPIGRPHIALSAVHVRHAANTADSGASVRDVRAIY